MAKSAAGKWVSRVGASGGGKAYKKTRPGNYYGILAVIVILGLMATLFARYEYQHPTAAVKGTPPAIGTTWYAGLAVEVCGRSLPYLSPDPNYRGGFTIQSNNVVRISPVSAADAGSHATLSQFAAEFPGLIASSNELAVPTVTGVANPATTYHNGTTCGASTKYAGQSAQVSYAYWTSLGQKQPKTTTDPTKIKFAPYLRVTMAFNPSGVVAKPPTQVTTNAMVAAAITTTTTTIATPSTLPTTSSTTSHSSTTTSTVRGAATTTTVKSTTTTAKG